MSTEQTRYWCHVCNREMPIYMAPEPTCQHCNEQFIEELHSDDDPREFLAGAETQNEGSGTTVPSTDETGRPTSDATLFSFGPRPREQDSGESREEVFQFFAPRSANENDSSRASDEAGPSPLTNMIQNMLTNIMGENMEGRGDANQPLLFYGDYVNGSFRFRSADSQSGTQNTADAPENESQEAGNENDGENGTQGEETTRQNGGARINGINSILQYLAAITGGTFDGGMVGNPNDYVFSQTALDNIITQLMEQTAGASAPPPATDQVIESLKKRNLTDEEKKQDTDCAVCKDAFEIEETVIELPCEHIFHDDCIKPWLKLNGTCPVCRHSVSPEKKEQDVPIESSENTSTSETTQNNPSSNRNNPTTATFTFINGQPAQGSNATSGSWPENIASLFQSVGTSMQSNIDQQSSQTSSSNNEQHDESDMQYQTNNSDQSPSNSSSQQKPSTDNNNNNNSDVDQDRLYMDLD